MIRSGTKPTRVKHTDYDFLKSHRFGGTKPAFADEYFADAGLTMPDQNIQDTEYSPPTPPMPEGCTNFAQAELATDLERTVFNPNDLEAVTHANAQGGLGIRDSLDAARRLGWFKQFFNIRASGLIDFFDSFRVAQVMGVNAGEHRSISWGTPWFLSWEKAAQSGQSIMPMPTDEELGQIASLPWHDSKLDGWSNKFSVAPGRELYRDKSWQGKKVGDNGFLYFPREVINMVMSIQGTVAFTPSDIGVDFPIRIDVTTIQWVVSFIQTLLERYVYPTGGTVLKTGALWTQFREWLHKKNATIDEILAAIFEGEKPANQPMSPDQTQTGNPAPNAVNVNTVDTLLPWVDKVGSEDNRHNVRVLCDLAGLDMKGKNVITACIEQESDFWPSAIGKPNADGTRDWGICQYNDGKLRGVPLWIGPHAAFKTTDEVLTDPTKSVNLMIDEYKAGHIVWWVSYSSGAYLKFMPK